MLPIWFRKRMPASLVTSGRRPSLLLRWRTTSVWFSPIEAIHGEVGSKNRTVVTLWPLSWMDGMGERSNLLFI